MGFTNIGGRFSGSSVAGSDATLAYNDSIDISFSGTSPLAINAQYLEGTEFKDVGNFPTGLLGVSGPTEFTSDAISAKALSQQNSMEATQTDNGQIVGAYRTGGDLKFFVLNGTTFAKDVSETTITSTCNITSSNVIEVEKIPGTNNFVIAWIDTTASNQGRFAIFSSAGAVIKAATTFETSAAEVSVGTFSDGRIVLCADVGSASNYTIFDSAGTELEASTEITSAGTSNNISVAVLTNDFMVFAMEVAASDGAFFIYDASTNPSTLKVGETLYTDFLSANSANIIERGIRNGFAITHRDTLNAQIVQVTSIYRFVNDTTWENVGELVANTFEGSTVGPVIDGDLSQGLYFISTLSNDGNATRQPYIALFDSTTLAPIITGFEKRTMTPFSAGTDLSYTMLIIDDKKLIIMYRDGGDSDRGKFIVYQLTHFTMENDATGSVKITNRTGVTQNVKALVAF